MHSLSHRLGSKCFPVNGSGCWTYLEQMFFSIIFSGVFSKFLIHKSVVNICPACALENTNNHPANTKQRFHRWVSGVLKGCYNRGKSRDNDIGNVSLPSFRGDLQSSAYFWFGCFAWIMTILDNNDDICWHSENMETQSFLHSSTMKTKLDSSFVATFMT